MKQSVVTLLLSIIKINWISIPENHKSDDGKILSELQRVCDALSSSLGGAHERHCPYIKRTAGEVKDSPQEKSKTLFSHCHTDSNSLGCQSILIKLL